MIRLPLSAGTLQGFRSWFLSTPRPKGVQFSFLGDVVWIGSDEMDFNITIPVTAFDPLGFREWAVSPDYPRIGRISLLKGELWIDMSPEEIETHMKVKTAICVTVHRLNRQSADMGEFYGDDMLLTLPNGLFHHPRQPSCNLLVLSER